MASVLTTRIESRLKDAFTRPRTARMRTTGSVNLGETPLGGF